MGMSDSVWFKCPNCGERMEAQSKGGECYMNNYNPGTVPYDVARDARIWQPCQGCKKAYRILPVKEPELVALEIEEITDYDGRKYL